MRTDASSPFLLWYAVNQEVSFPLLPPTGDVATWKVMKAAHRAGFMLMCSHKTGRYENLKIIVYLVVVCRLLA